MNNSHGRQTSANTGIHTGLSLRDYFAAAALPSLITLSYNFNSVTRNDVVREAYQYADAMLAARESQG